MNLTFLREIQEIGLGEYVEILKCFYKDELIWVFYENEYYSIDEYLVVAQRLFDLGRLSGILEVALYEDDE